MVNEKQLKYSSQKYDIGKYNKLCWPKDDPLQIPYLYSGTPSLVTQNLPGILARYPTQKAVLDYGCGAGLSSRFLQHLGHKVMGVDINENMLNFARQNDPQGTYLKINPDETLPFAEGSFETIVSIFVLFEIPSLSTMVQFFKNASKVLTENGVYITITGSGEDFYRKNWATVDGRRFSENQELKSGGYCKVNLTDVDLIIEDYYWTQKDYESAAAEAGLRLVEKHLPLARPEEGVNWKDELKYAPFVFYVFKKQL